MMSISPALLGSAAGGDIEVTPVRGTMTIGTSSGQYGFNAVFPYGIITPSDSGSWVPDSSTLLWAYSQSNTVSVQASPSAQWDGANIIQLRMFAGVFPADLLLVATPLTWDANSEYNQTLDSTFHNFMVANVGNTLGYDIVKIS